MLGGGDVASLGADPGSGNSNGRWTFCRNNPQLLIAAPALTSSHVVMRSYRVLHGHNMPHPEIACALACTAATCEQVACACTAATRLQVTPHAK